MYYYGNYIFAENGIFFSGNSSEGGANISFQLDERNSITNTHREAPIFEGSKEELVAFHKSNYLKVWKEKLNRDYLDVVHINFDIDFRLDRQDLLGCCGAATYSGLSSMYSKKVFVFEENNYVSNSSSTRLSMFNSMSNINRSFIESIQTEMHSISYYHRNRFLEKVVESASLNKRNIIILSDSSNEIKYQGMSQFRTVVSGQNFKTSNALYIYTLTINDAQTLIKNYEHLTKESIKPLITAIKTKLKCKLDEEMKLVSSLLEATQKSSLETAAAV